MEEVTNYSEEFVHPQIRYLMDEIDSKQHELSSLVETLGVKDLTKIDLPFVKKDVVLMSPGVWNNYYYDLKTIEQAWKNTDWEEKERHSLFLDHKHSEAGQWVGEVRGLKFDGINLVGDLVLVDEDTARKIAYGAKFGISPKVLADDDGDFKITEFKFDNFAIVINPAVKTAWINNVEVLTMGEKEKVEETPEEIEETSEASVEEAAGAAESAESSDAPSAEELSEMFENSAYTDFVKEGRKKGWDFKKIAAEWKKKEGKKMSELSDQNAQIINLLSELLELKKKKEYPEPEMAKKKEPEEEEEMVKKDEEKYPKEQAEKKEKYPYKEEAEKEKRPYKEKEMAATVRELAEKVNLLVDSPDRQTGKSFGKSFELSDVDTKNADIAMLEYLQSMRSE